MEAKRGHRQINSNGKQQHYSENEREKEQLQYCDRGRQGMSFENSNTTPHALLSKKKRADADEELTVKTPINLKVEQKGNKQVQEIIQNIPLREKICDLHDEEVQLPLSFYHQMLLRKVEILDSTIEFLASQRDLKTFYFHSLVKNIQKSSSVFIEQTDLQQLLFLDEEVYKVQWGYNEKIKRYDLKISLPKIQSKDERKFKLRGRIIRYMRSLEQQVLQKKNIVKKQKKKWHNDFDYKSVKIPLKPLPVHPQMVNAQVRAMQNKKIQQIENPHVKQIFKKAKVDGDAGSISAVSVKQMIFSGVPSDQIAERIMNAVREKEKAKMKQKQIICEKSSKIDKKILLKVCEQILMIFMSKRVSNIFKTSLIDILKKHLRYNDDLIIRCLDRIIDQSKEVQFLKQIESSQKLKVIQIQRTKFKELRQQLQQVLDI